jgi:hypothetical protein
MEQERAYVFVTSVLMPLMVGTIVGRTRRILHV